MRSMMFVNAVIRSRVFWSKIHPLLVRSKLIRCCAAMSQKALWVNGPRRARDWAKFLKWVAGSRIAITVYRMNPCSRLPTTVPLMVEEAPKKNFVKKCKKCFFLENLILSTPTKKVKSAAAKIIFGLGPVWYFRAKSWDSRHFCDTTQQ